MHQEMLVSKFRNYAVCCSKMVAIRNSKLSGFCRIKTLPGNYPENIHLTRKTGNHPENRSTVLTKLIVKNNFNFNPADQLSGFFKWARFWFVKKYIFCLFSANHGMVRKHTNLAASMSLWKPTTNPHARSYNIIYLKLDIV